MYRQGPPCSLLLNALGLFGRFRNQGFDPHLDGDKRGDGLLLLFGVVSGLYTTEHFGFDCRPLKDEEIVEENFFFFLGGGGIIDVV